MNESYAREHSFPVYPLSNPRTLTVVDGRPIAGGILTHYTWTFMKIGDHIEQLPMLLTSLGHYPVILGVKWARLHGVKLDMHRNEIHFDSEYCLKNCLPNKTPLTVAGLPINDLDSDSGYESDPNPESPFPISTGDSPISTGDSPISTGDSPISTGGSFASPVHHECAAFITTPLTRRLSQRVYPITTTGRHLTNTSAASYARKVQKTRLLTPTSNIQAFNVAMIGSAPFNLLSKKKDVQIFAISLRDIEKALETKVEMDPKTLVPEEFHSDPRFMKAFSK